MTAKASKARAAPRTPDGTPVMPQVRVYPKCSECGAPYVLRLVFIVLPRSGEEWLWQRDCKHKKAPPVSSDSETHPERALEAEVAVPLKEQK